MQGNLAKISGLSGESGLTAVWLMRDPPVHVSTMRSELRLLERILCGCPLLAGFSALASGCTRPLSTI